MIYEALEILVKDLKAFLKSVGISSENLVDLENIAHYEGGASGGNNSLQNKIILTLINIEEEKTLRNLPQHKIVNETSRYKNPPIHLNLYLLFSITSSYTVSLQYLSWIIIFFQQKNVFTTANTPAVADSNKKISRFKIILDLYSPTFEEANFLWSTLGGKQLPSVIYKLRLVELKYDLTKEARGVIKEINIQNDKAD